MLRLINALILSLTLVITSYSTAVARGQNPDLGTDIVICSGVGMTTITIGPDGEPIEKTHICPDSTSLFTALFAVDSNFGQPSAMQWRYLAVTTILLRQQYSRKATARGPPLGV